ncbi:hypothetical protein A2164_01775 [Candidatus Curtissbacteria bacterium RBG_13_35_7]|uniref:Uncharacterized protein n=1 Tax=Candidatus Curtissbacteria bacterium RBG_13_35_7 TaxID=1797705 RepID=A0A1F5G472_9BACT|nr:MAG: hypothetical protein A2164_01775 [Candidatus Curtissbacteria bacterium RBG_13_35_7]
MAKEEDIKPGEKFKNIQRPLGKMLLYNFLGGIFWGFGALIGTTIIVAIVAFFATRIDFVPIIGQFVTDIIKEVTQSNHVSPLTQ